MTDVGGVGQANVTSDYYDSDYQVGIHGYDEFFSGVSHDQADSASDGSGPGKNRFHIQSYFEKVPMNNCYATRSADAGSVDFRIYADSPPMDSDTDIDFENFEPSQQQLRNESSYNKSFAVSVPLTPWLPVSPAASISLSPDGTNSNHVTEDPYNSVETKQSFPMGAAVPKGPDDSFGFKFDMVPYRGIGGETIHFESEFEFGQVCNRSYAYKTTDVASGDAFIDII